MMADSILEEKIITSLQKVLDYLKLNPEIENEL
jgi:hypothetical protein